MQQHSLQPSAFNEVAERDESTFKELSKIIFFGGGRRECVFIHASRRAGVQKHIPVHLYLMEARSGIHLGRKTSNHHIAGRLTSHLFASFLHSLIRNSSLLRITLNLEPTGRQTSAPAHTTNVNHQ